MESNLQIRPIQIADHYEAVAHLLHMLHINERMLFDKTAAWADIEAGYMRHVMQMQAENEGLCLMACINDKPVGLIFGYLEEQDDSRIEIYEGKELYVSDGVVLEEYRRLGIYKKLNEALEKHFVAQGIKRMIRFTLVNNTKMQYCLEKEGYKVTRLQYEKWL